MRYTDDPVKDFEAWDFERSKRDYSDYPVCYECGEYIEDDEWYKFDDVCFCCDCVADKKVRICL